MKFFILFLNLAFVLHAAPALSKEKTLTQSDGSTFKATPKGDEYLHYLKTEDGDILVYNPKTKNYDYAIIKNDTLTPSGNAYKKNKLYKALNLKKRNNISDKELFELRKKRLKSISKPNF